MHIREIHVENIRCFGGDGRGVHVDLTRPDGSLAGWTVFAGRNGTGKSTLLKAVALAVVGPSWTGKLQDSFVGWVRKQQHGARSEVTLSGSREEEHHRRDQWVDKAAIQWLMPGGRAEPVVEGSCEPAERRRDDFGEWNPERWFLAAYGPVRRIGARDDSEESPPVKARVKTLFDENATLSEALSWLRNIHAQRLDYLDREKRASDVLATLDLQGKAESLREIQTAVLSLLQDGLLLDGVEITDFNMDGLWIRHTGVDLPLRQLSDGYRSVVALVFDVVRQMHHCFGELRVERGRRDGREIVTIPYEGVVLIDEVESHLHVSWQQKIGFWLKEHFPAVQFLVTTHSPFICQAADRRGLIVLPPPDEDRSVGHVSEETYWKVVNGGADEAAMTELFGLETVYSRPAESLRDRIARIEARLVRGAATPAEKEELFALLQKVPRTGSAMVEQELRKLGELR